MCGCNKRSSRGSNVGRSAAPIRRPVRSSRPSSLAPRGGRIIDKVNRGPKRR